jgi:lipopolysaccharide biosynthesis protein
MSDAGVRRGLSIVERSLPHVHVVAGAKDPAVQPKAAFVASYADSPRVSGSLARLVNDLDSAGYGVVLIRASDRTDELEWPKSHRVVPTVVHKPNLGYDFGSWAVGLHLFPALTRKSQVLLTNDSLVGPFDSEAFVRMLRDFDECPADVWGATSSLQFLPHLQSFFLGFRGGLLSRREFRSFWDSLPVETDKMKIVLRYELGLARLLFSEGYTTKASFPSELTVADGQNPTIQGWRELIELGFPFLKRTLLSQPDLVGSGESPEHLVRRKFGVELADLA